LTAETPEKKGKVAGADNKKEMNMKTFLMILIILTGITIQAQVDTLMVGNRKFPLKLVGAKIHQSLWPMKSIS